MSTHRNIDKICIVIVAFTLVIAVVFCGMSFLGVTKDVHAIGYENRIFDRSKVHTIDIVMNDWDGFIENCESEQYSPCNLVIDGEVYKNVGIRVKGNTSLSSVKNSGSSRYSFKIEFDQYDKTKSYHGLDKLCLNNIIQDNTYMKDYLAYTLMYDFGVDSPLCSYAFITVNGEDWGLYLAVEAVEQSFLERNYGSNYGDLYKPDSMSFGGGRGNGRDFDMNDFIKENISDDETSGNEETDKSDPNTGSSDGQQSQNSGDISASDGSGRGNMPSMPGNMPEGFSPGNMPGNMPEGFSPDNLSEGFDPSSMPGGGNPGAAGPGGGPGGMGGMGSDDVKLKYIDDSPESYSNIFGNAKTTVNTADEHRLIKSLKALSGQTDLENVLDTDEVIRYFVVHNFLCNGDSYTGQMIHNYYLYEKDGQLSMIPWDYNLAFGSFSGGEATSSVNSPIDTPVSGGMSDRPMISWIFDSEEYTEQYHKLFSEFIGSVDLEKTVTETAAMIDSYVKKDKTAFCTYEEYKKGVEAIKSFCTLRTESVKGQLDGTIPSTTEGQNSDSSSLVDASSLTISDMGTMGSGGGGGFGGGAFGGKTFERPGRSSTDSKSESSPNSTDNKKESSQSVADTKNDSSQSGGSDRKNPFSQNSGNGSGTFGRKGNDGGSDTVISTSAKAPDDKVKTTASSASAAAAAKAAESVTTPGVQPPQGFDRSMPEGFDPAQMPGGQQPPQGFDGSMPEGFDPTQMPGGQQPPQGFDGSMPEGFDPTQNPGG